MIKDSIKSEYLNPEQLKKKPSLNSYLNGCRQIYFSDKEIEKGLNENEESIKRAMRYFRVMRLHKMEIPSLTSDMYFKKI